MTNGLLTDEERQKRIAEVRKKGVFFHTYSARTTPLSKEDADKLINDNIDAFIGNKRVMSSEEAVDRLRERFAK
ncbi:MAG: hypothetical protein IJS01_08070 [Lentisphaeria bacterium]|nr:hypothetical protein [Lentisphaeria bacterium]